MKQIRLFLGVYIAKSSSFQCDINTNLESIQDNLLTYQEKLLNCSFLTNELNKYNDLEQLQIEFIENLFSNNRIVISIFCELEYDLTIQYNDKKNIIKYFNRNMDKKILKKIDSKYKNEFPFKETYLSLKLHNNEGENNNFRIEGYINKNEKRNSSNILIVNK